jgi:hypothetical protein
MRIEIKPGFSLDELLAHLRREPEMAEGYYTAREWAAHFGISLVHIHEILAQAKAESKLLVQHVKRERIDEVRSPVPVYQFNLDDDEGTLAVVVGGEGGRI